jgi:Transposase
VRDWLGEQSEAFWKMIKIVVIDPPAPYASGIRAALPAAKIAVDKWHLLALANQMVTRSGNASHAIFWAGAARLPTRCWRTGGCCSLQPNTSHRDSGSGSVPCSTTATRQGRSAPPGV